MKKESYFNNIIGIGELYIDYEIVYYDCPLVFTCLDNKDNLYLCICSDMCVEQKWIISLTTTQIIKDFLQDKIDLFEAIKNPICQKYNVTYKDGTETSKKVDFKSIPETDLPDKGFYLEAAEGEFEEYIILLNSRENIKNN